MPGPGMPRPDDPITVDVFLNRWPTAVERVELIHGVLLFQGVFDEEDVATALRTYPGRRVLLNGDGNLEVHPGGTKPPVPLTDRYG